MRKIAFGSWLDKRRFAAYCSRPDIGQWISAHLPRDMRSLTRVMDVANQIALHAQRKVTLQVIREAARAAGMAEDESIAQQGEAPTALFGTGH